MSQGTRPPKNTKAVKKNERGGLQQTAEASSGGGLRSVNHAGVGKRNGNGTSRGNNENGTEDRAGQPSQD